MIMKDWDHFAVPFLKRTKGRLEFGFALTLGLLLHVQEARFKLASAMPSNPLGPHPDTLTITNTIHPRRIKR